MTSDPFYYVFLWCLLLTVGLLFYGPEQQLVLAVVKACNLTIQTAEATYSLNAEDFFILRFQ